MSHWVELGSVIPNPACNFSIRGCGNPTPKRSIAIMAAAVASYFWSPTPTGADAVKISSHRLQRNRAHSYTAAEMGAAPVKRTRNLGSASG